MTARRLRRVLGLAAAACAATVPACARHAPAVERPRAVACTLRGGTWPPHARGVGMRLHPGGDPYVDIAAATEVEIVLPVGPVGTGAFARVGVGGVELSGFIDATNVEVYSARPFLVGGAFVPLPFTPLRMIAAREGAVDVALDDLAGFRAPAALARDTRPCADLSPSGAWFEPLDALAPVATRSTATLDAGAEIRLAVRSGTGGAIEVLRQQTDAAVDVLARAGGEARIAVWGPSAVAVGWIAADRLGPPSPAATRHARPDSSPRGHGHSHLGVVVTCSADVPLIAEVGGERRIVGRASPGVPIDRGSARDRHFEIELPSAPLTISPAARLLAPAPALAACVPATTARRAP